VHLPLVAEHNKTTSIFAVIRGKLLDDVFLYVTGISDMQIGLDGKLYCATSTINLGRPPMDVTFVVVENPDLKTLQDNLRTKVSFFDMQPRLSRPVLPNYMQHYFEGLAPIDYPVDVDISCKGAHVIRIYPNPTNHAVSIEIAEECHQPDAFIQLFNVIGQKIMEQSIPNPIGTELDLSLLASGTYVAVLYGTIHRTSGNQTNWEHCKKKYVK
jgi:hypothetical protein